ncbi:SDR family oxidoreductase [Rhizobiaceae sp. 2RAB30]
MLKGKRAVVTGGGRDFGQALGVWLAREGVAVDLCARTLAGAETTRDIILQEGGQAEAHECDISDAGSVARFSDRLLTRGEPIDILILSAAQWLEGRLGEDDSDEQIVSTINSGLTGSILLTRALLPIMNRDRGSDIVAMVSVCGLPNFTDSIAHPAFFAAKHGIGGFCQTLAPELAKENIRVTGLYPPDFEVTGFDVPLDDHLDMTSHLLNARSVWETMRLVLTLPRSCHINAIHFRGPTRQDLA